MWKITYIRRIVFIGNVRSDCTTCFVHVINTYCYSGQAAAVSSLSESLIPNASGCSESYPCNFELRVYNGWCDQLGRSHVILGRVSQYRHTNCPPMAYNTGLSCPAEVLEPNKFHKSLRSTLKNIWCFDSGFMTAIKPLFWSSKLQNYNGTVKTATTCTLNVRSKLQKYF